MTAVNQKFPFPPRYFVASVVLLAALVALLAISVARRTQQELSRQLEDKGRALADALETTSRNAIAANALMEEMIAQRLLDNARLIDELLLVRPLDSEALARIRSANGLARLELLDRDGRPYTPPPAPPMPRMMGPMMHPGGPPDGAEHPAMTAEAREHRRAMMMYMWGRRWSVPAAEGAVPPAIRDRRFWEGTVFGVAVAARSFPGIIAAHADAAYVLNFSREIGVQRQVEELARQPGIQSIALLDQRLSVLAHSSPERVGRQEDDPELRNAVAEGRTLARLVHSDGRAPAYEIAKPLALDKQRPGLLTVALSTADMDRIWRRDRAAAGALAAAVLVLGSLGMAAIFFVQHRRAAEVRALEAEMERRERLASLGNMAAGVAHEIRNPLNAVSMGLQRLRAEFEPADAGEYHALVDVVLGEVRRLNTIVEDFLSLARPLSLDIQPVEVIPLLRELRGLLDGESAAAGVELEVEAQGDVPTVEADRGRLMQVLLNLALNAIQATPRGGRVTLAARRSRAGVSLTVEDTGAGIAPEVLPHLFEPYVTTKVRGVGLGLAIARRIAEAHGGRIQAEPRARGGTRFTVTLPPGGARHE